MGNGLTATMMPVDNTYVSYGDSIFEGQAVGVLAASGDKSLSQTHLHVGLKKKTNSRSVYLDPGWLIGVGGSDVSNEQELSGESAVFSGAETGASSLGESALAQEQIALGDLGVEEFVSTGVLSDNLATNTELLEEAGANPTITSGNYSQESLDFIDEQSLQNTPSEGPIEWIGDKLASLGTWLVSAAKNAMLRLSDLFTSISQDVSTIPAVTVVGVTLIAVLVGVVKVAISVMPLVLSWLEKMGTQLKHRTNFVAQLRQTLTRAFGSDA